MTIAGGHGFRSSHPRGRNDSEVPMQPVPVTVVSDVVCPWCYIGKRRLEQALALRPDIPVEVRWHPYFLNPWVPRAGMSRADYLTQKFGSVERYKGIAQRVAAAAAAEGLVYDLDKISRQPNTLDCHRLILWAGNGGDPAGMKQRLMELYFAEGADLSDREVLVGAAVDCGLDADTVRDRLAGDADVARVEQEANAAKEAGIDGVPCFIFGNVLAVSGAQSPDYLADALARAAAEHQRRTAAPAEPASRRA
jgi:predicted DsbA family dithiol-disulfide isomerase